jgi:nucleoside 2-deoxyribosyltransferase
MPFSDTRELQAVYRDHVKPVIERLGLKCERADDIYDVSGIMQSVWDCINRARFVVADLTERNANVFYELGIAHTLGKPVIMITQSIEFVPFDLRHLRCITYSYTPRGAAQLELTLERTIRTILGSAADLRVS